MTFADTLPHFNASMNAISATCLIAGVVAVLSKNIESHKRWMLGAVLASSIFLIGYLTRFALSGTTYFQGSSLTRTIYLSILYSHMTLAVVTIPLVIRLLFLAKVERIDEHKKLARLTLPIWLYVSITGIVVYLFLYHFQ